MRVNNLLERKNRREAERNGRAQNQSNQMTNTQKSEKSNFSHKRNTTPKGIMSRKSKSKKTQKSNLGRKAAPSKAASHLNKNRLLDHSSDEEDHEGGDQSRREHLAKQELEELDRQYFINDDNMDATDGFFNKAANKYGGKKHQVDLAPLKSPYIQVAHSENQSELQGLSESSSHLTVADNDRDDTAIEGRSGSRSGTQNPG